MRGARTVLSRDAERDLDELFDYIAADSGAYRAGAVLERIESTVSLIADMPLIGRVRHDLRGGPRSFAVWPWLIIYRPLVDEDGIFVLRVIDGRRDVPRRV